MRILRVELAGQVVDVHTSGHGPVVLLVPGGAARNRDYWLDLPERLSPHATVVTFDRPGVGTSPHHEAPLTLTAQAGHIGQVIKEVGGGPAVLVGHSLGGPVSVQLAADSPELVSSLVLLDPTPISLQLLHYANIGIVRLLVAARQSPRLAAGIDRGMRRTFEKEMAAFPRTPALERAASVLTQDDQLAQLARLLPGLARDTRQLHSRLKDKPLTVGGFVVSADRGARAPMRAAHVQLAQLLHATFESWSGTTHGLHLQRPDRVIETIQRVIAS